MSSSIFNNHHWWRPVLTLLTGFVGGLIACGIHSPIPWLLGSLCITVLVGSTGFTLAPISKPASRWLQVIIGVSLGTFVAASLDQFSVGHSSAVIFGLGFTLIVTALGTWFFRRTLGFDAIDGFISALPGGLSFLISLSSDLGKRFPRIGFMHTLRITTLVFGFSFLVVQLGESRPIMSIEDSLAFSWHPELLILVVIIGLCGWLADHSRIAGGHVIFGLVGSTLAYKFGVIDLPVPQLMISLSMTALGVLLGVELLRDRETQYRRLALASLAYTSVTLIVAAMMAWAMVWLMHWLTPESVAPLTSNLMETGFLLYLLALAPGGIAEVSLITLSLGLDVGLVAMVHTGRFFLIMLIGPLGLRHFTTR